MKNLLLTLILVMAWNTSGQAQQIYAQSFPKGIQASHSIGFTITLTTSGPIEVIASSGPAPTLAATVNMSLSISGGPAGGTYTDNVASSALVYTTPDLPAGTYSVGISANYSNSSNPTGSALVIAPNEPGNAASDQSAINTINSEISSLQSQISSDETNIAALQAAVANTSLQTAEAQDAANISVLQTELAGLDAQLTAIDNTLQGEITSQGNQITALQAAEALDASNIATIQGQIASLQAQTDANSSAISGLQSSLATVQANQATDEANIATLQEQQAATEARLQADETNIATLQSQQLADQTTLANLQAEIAKNQSVQAAENSTLQKQINRAVASESSDHASLQNEVNGLKRSNRLSRALIYGGLGIGMAGLGTGIGAIVGEDNPDESTPPDNSSAEPATDPKDVTYP